MKSFVYIATILLFFTTLLGAQPKTNSALTGKIFDKSTNQPLEYATVSVINIQSGKTINGTITDVRGAFTISDLPFGTYKILIGFIGYENITVDNVSLTSKKLTVSLGTLYLPPSMMSLQNVTITGDKPIVENKIDKIVYNAANDITSQGGAAIDVLKKVPQVTVDVDGNVELQGNSNIRFLINGKPSSIFGSSLADALASIPASQIKSIEAITNPGAKYDSQGTGGIINIILQDNKMKGVNGNINLSAGSKLENASVNLNMRHNNFGMNAFFGGRAQLKSQMPSTQQRITTDTVGKAITALSQDGLSEFQRHGFHSGIGFDWDISKNDNINGSFGYNLFGNDNTGVTNLRELIKNFSDSTLSDIYSIRNSESHSKFSSFDWSLAYKKKFKKEGQELDLLYNSSHGTPNMNYTQTQSYQNDSTPYTGQSSFNPGTDDETEVSVDYTHPITENFKIETGAKSTFQKLHSIADVSVFNPGNDLFVADPLQSYDSKYDLNVYAGYLSATFKLFHYLDIQSGVRYEYTQVKLDNPNTSVPSYGTIVPTIVLSHNFDKNQSLKFSYSKRLERPGYRELNPFIDLSDPYNISTGNPYLKPELGNNFELGYNATFKKGGNVYVSLIERINTQDVKQITTFYPEYLIGDSTYTNVSVTTRQNVGEEYNSGLSASGSYPVTSHLNLRGNIMFLHRYSVIDLGTGNNSTGFRTRFNLNATYQLPKDLVIELFAMYSAPSQGVQGKVPQFFIYNFAFRKMFWDKKGSLGFTATNPFNKYINQVTTINTPDYASKYVRQMPFRSFGISFTYKFGKLEFNKKKEDNSNNQGLEDFNR
jgi:outer membrane receptor protein involved in Fe transport